MTNGAPALVNALTIDFEDWYQGLEIPLADWESYEDRIDLVGLRLLDLLAEADVRATFFVLGYVAERHPELVRAIHAAGHEVATHGYSHTLIYRQAPEIFRSELARSVRVLEDLTGERVLGHRAPFFSITRQSLWALDVIAEQGLAYDSSIFPVRNYRYGIPDSPRWPHTLPVGQVSNGPLPLAQACDPSGNAKGGLAGDGNGRPARLPTGPTEPAQLIEFPMSTVRILGQNVPVAGGAYFRILPYWLTRSAFRSINRLGRPAVFYLHPWELDPEHPRIPLPRRIAGTHYYNLHATEPRLRALLREFRFAPMHEVLDVR